MCDLQISLWITIIQANNTNIAPWVSLSHSSVNRQVAIGPLEWSCFVLMGKKPKSNITSQSSVLDKSYTEKSWETFWENQKSPLGLTRVHRKKESYFLTHYLSYPRSSSVPGALAEQLTTALPATEARRRAVPVLTNFSRLAKSFSYSAQPSISPLRLSPPRKSRWAARAQ